MHPFEIARIASCIEKLTPLCAKGQDLCWISSADTDGVGDECYCPSCASKAVVRGNAEAPGANYQATNTHGLYVSERPLFCCKCGAVLKSQLSDYAVQDELDYYSSCPLDSLDAVAYPDSAGVQAFRLLQILQSPAMTAHNTDEEMLAGALALVSVVENALAS